MPPNTLWRIAFGDYDLTIERRTLTYRLVETRTGTIWADALSVGFIELQERESGARSRHDFGQTALFSLEEKAGPRGKEILFGLDCLGIPIDVYFLCSEREIQLVVEANRDSKTHRVSAVGLLPGLCAVPDDGVSYLVVPDQEGAVVLARDVPGAPRDLPVWSGAGLTMPFIGAVRGDGDARSAAALITDSAYAAARRGRGDDGAATLDWIYDRDPERRRLEVRIVPLPGGDHISIARTYREKIVGERNHVTLRRKLRERPALDSLLGGAVIELPVKSLAGPVQPFTEIARIARDLREGLGVERGVCVLSGAIKPGDLSELSPLSPEAGGEEGLHAVCRVIRERGFLAGIGTGGTGERIEQRLPEIEARCAPNAWLDLLLTRSPLSGTVPPERSRWDDMEERMAAIQRYQQQGAVFGSGYGSDWSAIACDFWHFSVSDRAENLLSRDHTASVPLEAVVYHDAVVSYGPALSPEKSRRFLRALLMLSPPAYSLRSETYFDEATGIREYVRRTHAVLAPLHRLTFPAFLTGHRFLTPDFLVEEARYTDGTQVIINQGDAPYENDQAALPPGGFVAAHSQFTAHDAVRVGGDTFTSRAWRIARTRDDKPLAESAKIERREFPV